MPPQNNSKAVALAHLTWCQVKEAIDAKSVVILPIGSTEAHGPHLPLETDVIISQEMARRAGEKLVQKGISVVLAPPIAYSLTEFSSDFPGTISIHRDTAYGLIRDIGISLGAQGFRTICLANSHLEPDHIQLLREAAEAISIKTGAAVCFPDKTRKHWADTLTEEFRSGACHAGQYESSLVMAARPELVNDSIRKSLKPNLVSLSEKIKSGAKTFKQAGGPDAYFGDPASAGVQEGQTSYDALSEMLVTVILGALEGSPPKVNHVNVDSRKDPTPG